MRRCVDDLLAEARAALVRLDPNQALDAQRRGAVLVDVRSEDQLRTHGCIPGAIHVPRNVLEWRADPDCAHHDPRIADLDRHLILVCEHGFQSSLAAANLQHLGFSRATDLDGGFEAWQLAGLPVEAWERPARDCGI